MTMPQAIDASASPEVQVNENFGALDWAFCYAHNPPADTGLTRGYSGGRWGGFDVSDVAHAFGASTTTYASVERATGDLDFSTSSTNFDDGDNYARVEVVVTSGSAVTSVTDHRGGPGGVHFGGGGTPTAGRDDVTALATSGSIGIDYSLGDYFTLALGGNVSTFTFSNLPGSGKGASLMVKITQDSTPRTVGWPASFKFADGADDVVSTGSGVVDLLGLTTFDNGTTWLATLSKDYS